MPSLLDAIGNQLSGLRLREALPADLPFLRGLYRQTRQREMDMVPWSQADKNAFCDSQFALQDSHYRQHYPHAHFWVVERDGRAVGRMYVNDAPELLGLMEVTLDAPERGHGLGTQLLRALMAHADSTARLMQLHVEAENPALHWYLRNDFTVVQTAPVYLELHRAPAQPGGLNRG